MKLVNVPPQIPAPFGAACANTTTISNTSLIGIIAGAASRPDGYPPLCFADPADGGVAPRGIDMNGLGFELSNAMYWGQAGGQYVYDSTYQTAIMGYPQGAVVARTDLTGWWQSLADDNTANPETGGGGWLPVHLGTTPLTLTLAGSNVALTALQAATGTVVLSGTLTGNVMLTLPAWAGVQWTYINNCVMGGYTITLTTGSGTTVVLAPGSQLALCQATGIGSTNGAIAGYLTAESTLTLGASPAVYQNVTAFTEDVLINGGVVSLIEFSRNGSTWYATGLTAGFIPLSPQDQVRVTYATAPTAIAIPR